MSVVTRSRSNLGKSGNPSACFGIANVVAAAGAEALAVGQYQYIVKQIKVILTRWQHNFGPFLECPLQCRDKVVSVGGKWFNTSLVVPLQPMVVIISSSESDKEKIKRTIQQRLFHPRRGKQRV
jgi:hypothetical protein